MARTTVGSLQIRDGDVSREDINVSDPGKAVITKIVAGGGMEMVYTGADPGTGDVTITPSGSMMAAVNDEAFPVVICSPVYISQADKVRNGKADAISTARVVGLTQDVSVAAGISAQIKTSGVFNATTGQWDAVTGQTGGLTAGAQYYLSPSVAGGLTDTKPSVEGQYVVGVGVALSQTAMVVMIGVPELLETPTLSSYL